MTIAPFAAGIPCAGHMNSRAVVRPNATTTATPAANARRQAREDTRPLPAAPWRVLNFMPRSSVRKAGELPAEDSDARLLV